MAKSPHQLLPLEERWMINIILVEERTQNLRGAYRVLERANAELADRV